MESLCASHQTQIENLEKEVDDNLTKGSGTSVDASWPVLKGKTPIEASTPPGRIGQTPHSLLLENPTKVAVLIDSSSS